MDDILYYDENLIWAKVRMECSLCGTQWTGLLSDRRCMDCDADSADEVDLAR